MSAALVAILQQDAELIADLARLRRGERADRLAARLLLARVYAVLEPPEAAQPTSADGPDPVALAAIALEAAALRRRLAGPGWQILRPIGEVWIREPYPEFFMQPSGATAAQRLAAQREAQFSLKLALNDQRVGWMEKRCTATQPGLLRPVRTPKTGEGNRLGASELELLRKRGRSKFS